MTGVGRRLAIPNISGWCSSEFDPVIRHKSLYVLNVLNRSFPELILDGDYRSIIVLRVRCLDGSKPAETGH